MHPRFALAVAVALAAILLGLPGAAAAKLVVTGPGAALGERGPTTISFEGAAPAALVLYAPPGFTASLGQAPGTSLGRATTVLASQGAEVARAGAIVADESATEACGTAGHTAVWRLSLDGAPGNVLVAVDAVGPGDAEAAYASYRLGLCPPRGVLVRSLELDLESVFANPPTAGAYAWHAVATPVDATGATDPAGAVESRSTQLVPVRLSLRGAYDSAQGAATLTGALTAAGRPLARIRVAIAAGRPGSSLARAGHATTGAAGRFRGQRPIAEATVFEALVDAPARSDPAGCPDPIAPAGCVEATLAPISVTSERVAVRVPSPRVLRLGSRGADVRRLQAELARLRFLPPGSKGAAFDERTWHAVVAFQGWQRLGRTGVVDRPTWRALARARVPVPGGGLRGGVVIDTARQVLLLVEGGRTVRAIHVSTGAYGRTPRGRFAVYRKEVLSWSVPFGVWMPYASYFRGGFAMHAYPSVPAYPASHGCVRLPASEAPGVYRFAAYGTPVWVR